MSMSLVAFVCAEAAAAASHSRTHNGANSHGAHQNALRKVEIALKKKPGGRAKGETRQPQGK